MNFSADFQRFVPVVAVAAVAVVAVALVARGVGGAHSKTASTQQVLQETLAGGKGAKSGKFAGALAVALQGVPGQAANPLSAKFSGAFDRTKTGKPQFQLNATCRSRRASASPSERSRQVTRRSSNCGARRMSCRPPAFARRRHGATPLASLGVEPRELVHERARRGQGTGGRRRRSTHVTADFDAGRRSPTCSRPPRRSGQGSQIPASAQKQQVDAVKSAKRRPLHRRKSDTRFASWPPGSARRRRRAAAARRSEELVDVQPPRSPTLNELPLSAHRRRPGSEPRSPASAGHDGRRLARRNAQRLAASDSQHHRARHGQAVSSAGVHAGRHDVPGPASCRRSSAVRRPGIPTCRRCAPLLD